MDLENGKQAAKQEIKRKRLNQAEKDGCKPASASTDLKDNPASRGQLKTTEKTLASHLAHTL